MYTVEDRYPNKGKRVYAVEYSGFTLTFASIDKLNEYGRLIYSPNVSEFDTISLRLMEEANKLYGDLINSGYVDYIRKYNF